MKNFSWILQALCLAGVTWVAYQLLNRVEQDQGLKNDHAQITHVEHGLLNPNVWKEKAADIFARKLQSFDITKGNEAQIKSFVDRALYTLLDEVEKIVERKTSQGTSIESFFKKMALGFIESIALDFKTLRKEVPTFRNRIIRELKKKETQRDLRRVLKKKIAEVLSKDPEKKELKLRQALITHYAETLDESIAKIQEKRRTLAPKIQEKLLLVVFISVISLLVLSLSELSLASLLLCLGFATVLLSCGVLMPMLDIHALIQKSTFSFWGEILVFPEQTLIFQSKSVRDVIVLLWRSATVGSRVVSSAIVLFTICFPILKLVMTACFWFRVKWRSNRVVHFFVFDSVKWAMTDVFVVSIFLAYLGFDGVIQHQMKMFQGLPSEHVEMLSTSKSSLEPAFYTFLLFVIYGYVLSIKMRTSKTERKQGETPSTNARDEARAEESHMLSWAHE